MPELDGPAVCREVRKKKDTGYVYMILLTSKGLKTDIVAGLESGADDSTIKPFDAEELKARMRTGQRILRSRRSARSKPASTCASKPPTTH